MQLNSFMKSSSVINQTLNSRLRYVSLAFAVACVTLACEDPTLAPSLVSSRLRVEILPEPTYRSASTLTTQVTEIPAGSWAPIRLSLLNIGYTDVNVTELCLTAADGSCQPFSTEGEVTFKLCGGSDDTPTSCTEAMTPIVLGPDQGQTVTLLYMPKSGFARDDNTSVIITSDDEISRFIVNVEASSCAAAVDGGCAAGDDLDGDGVPDSEDNCVNTPNGDQLDSDGDGRGDVCDEAPSVGNYLLQGASISQGAAIQESAQYRVKGTVISGAHRANTVVYTVQGRIEL